ncbi:hypothetical protein VPNG_08869 [Cytospora leucostoma]|uniref:Uncharacterized protein n=1 Tax=Cytospora leucostoma TaxID=1230097 RepID=A0A423VRS8_9PEZI|nr:hypothetical protein VPNG_08869 [Cytospora leucostoma]
MGGPIFQEDGKLVVPHQDATYLGEPREELDVAWRNLTQSTYIRITEEEAKTTWPDEYKNYWSESRSGYVAG